MAPRHPMGETSRILFHSTEFLEEKGDPFDPIWMPLFTQPTSQPAVEAASSKQHFMSGENHRTEGERESLSVGTFPTRLPFAMFLQF